MGKEPLRPRGCGARRGRRSQKQPRVWSPAELRLHVVVRRGSSSKQPRVVAGGGGCTRSRAERQYRSSSKQLDRACRWNKQKERTTLKCHVTVEGYIIPGFIVWDVL